jgi:hypothetical protein
MLICTPLLLCGWVLTFAWLRKGTVLGQEKHAKMFGKRKTLEEAIQESRDLVQRGKVGIVVQNLALALAVAHWVDYSNSGLQPI